MKDEINGNNKCRHCGWPVETPEVSTVLCSECQSLDYAIENLIRTGIRLKIKHFPTNTAELATILVNGDIYRIIRSPVVGDVVTHFERDMAINQRKGEDS